MKGDNGMSGRRWRLRGMHRRSGSANYYQSLHIPKDLWDQRDNLRNLGQPVPSTQQFSKSTGHSDRSKAQTVAAKMHADHLARMEQWRDLLDYGPVSLNHKQISALAGAAALELVKAYDEEPGAVPKPADLFVFVFGMLRAFDVLPSIYMGDAIADFLRELDGIPTVGLPSYLDDELAKAPAGLRVTYLEVARAAVENHLTAEGLLLASSAVNHEGLLVDRMTAERLAEHARRFVSLAYESLGQRLQGNYRPMDWELGVPLRATRSGRHGKTRPARRQREAASRNLQPACGALAGRPRRIAVNSK